MNKEFQIFRAVIECLTYKNIVSIPNNHEGNDDKK